MFSLPAAAVIETAQPYTLREKALSRAAVRASLEKELHAALQERLGETGAVLSEYFTEYGKTACSRSRCAASARSASTKKLSGHDRMKNTGESMERIISAERVEDILNVFGSFDQNLHIIEKEWNVCVTDRDAELKISGEPEDVVSAEKAVQNLLMLARAARTWTNSACAM